MLSTNKLSFKLIFLISIANFALKSDESPQLTHDNGATSAFTSSSQPKDDCITLINVISLCIDRLKADCIQSKKVATHELCTNKLTSKNINADNAILLELRTKKAQINTLSTHQSSINDACITTLSVGKGGLTQCGKYRASAFIKNDTPYTLGNDITFDIIDDDPNNDLTNSPTKYTVPVSGWYMWTVQTAVTKLQGPSLILGMPVALIQLLQNGNVIREQYTPFLMFNDTQRSIINSLISVKAGDILTVNYKVLTQDSAFGLIEYPGTATLLGETALPLNTARNLFKIHYISSDCAKEPCDQDQSCEDIKPTTCNQSCCNSNDQNDDDKDQDGKKTYR